MFILKLVPAIMIMVEIIDLQIMVSFYLMSLEVFINWDVIKIKTFYLHYRRKFLRIKSVGFHCGIKNNEKILPK
ncbi:hypothetical protein BLA29_013193 [Euroglyphus maynei]|uniref:Uncharacterized protein n=1 Tax=Euroglyphus maynei TaxID=6958 RepID=A0A1Y3B732_EURMA|nr:hypothetical protein BLA29_013193 [Euroglyphus maynei]